MRPTLLILRYRLRVLRRWLGAHAFEIFVLAPVIVGGVLWVVDRQLTHLREPLAGFAAGADPAPGSASLALALLLVAAALPATLRELYDHRGASGYLDALPVPPLSRFHATLAVELTRALPPIAVLLLATGALAGEVLPPASILAERSARLLAALLALALSRVAVALAVVRFRLLARGRWLALGAVAALAVVLPHPAARLALLPWLAPAAQLETVFLDALGVGGAATAWARPWPLALTVLALYLLARVLYLAWHRRDLETANHFSSARAGRLIARLLALGAAPRTSACGGGSRPNPTVPGASWLLQLAPGQPAAAQVGRDVALVLRCFSPAVPLAAGLALLLDAAVLAVLADLTLPELWRQRIAVAGLALSVLAVVALVPFLLKHQLPRFWIERSTGVELEQVWRAKLWTATLLAAAPASAGVAILLAAPGLGAVNRGAAVLQLLAAAWIVTSILGLAVFEIADQPLLGLLFGSLLGLAVAALFIFYPKAWWLWAVLYAWVASQIAGRATRRVRLLEVEA